MTINEMLSEIECIKLRLIGLDLGLIERSELECALIILQDLVIKKLIRKVA